MRVKRERIISTRVTHDEYAELEQLAARIGISLGELIRRASLAATYPPMAVSGSTLSAPLVRLQLEAI